MYHYIRTDSDEYPYFKHLHIDDFKKQLDFFEKEFGFISQNDLFKSLETGIPAKGIILTFDDGLKDHYQYVLPELKKRGLWGIFYVCTGVYKPAKILDVHKIHLLLGKFGGEKILAILNDKINDSMLSVKHRSAFELKTYNCQANDAYTVEAKRILNYYLTCEARDELLTTMTKELLGDESQLVSDFYLSPGEIVEMEAAGMLIGSHSVNHPVMSKLSTDEQRSEINDSFSWLDKTLNKVFVKSFSYPYGGDHSFNSATVDLLEAHSTMFSFSVDPKDISSENLLNNRQALSRYDCNMFPHGKVRV